MEVELKKTKINKSIVDQSLLGNYSILYNWGDYDILGWCSTKNKKYTIRYILLYNKVNNSIVKIPYCQSGRVEIKEESVQRSDKKGGWIFPTIKIITIYWVDLNNSIKLEQSENETYEDMENKLKKIKEFFNIANEKGQIYI